MNLLAVPSNGPTLQWPVDEATLIRPVLGGPDEGAVLCILLLCRYT